MDLQLSAILTTVLGIASALSLPPTTVPSGCNYKGQYYPEGDFSPSPCEFCQCHNGMPNCAIADCFITMCVDAVNDPDQCCPQCPNGHNCLTPDNFTLSAGHTHITKDGQKCKCDNFGTRAICTAPVHSGCLYNGQYQPVGSFKPSPCEYCTCPHDGGKVMCAIQDCAFPACSDQNLVHLPGQCCPVCQHTDTPIVPHRG